MSIVSIAFAYIANIAIQVISFFGYPGLFFLMILESMVFPLPSELVMPFAGYLASQNKLDFLLIVIASSLGSLIGSILSYYIGKYGGNKFLNKFGKYFLLDSDDLKNTEKWFKEKGEKTVFFSRFIPVVRHIISIPAGIGKMNKKRFVIFTIVGATLWNSFLAFLGYVLGKNWEKVRQYSDYLSAMVLILLVLAGIFFIYHHIKSKAIKKSKK